MWRRGKCLQVTGMAVIAILLASCSPPAASGQPAGTTASRASLTAAQRTVLAGLEARALVIPEMPTDGNCPDGPQFAATPFGAQSATDFAATGGMLYGAGPVYGMGGPDTSGKRNTYYDVTFFTDPTVRGVVLVRGQQLGGRWKVVMVGPWAAGGIAGHDVISGRQVTLYSELALPADHPRTKPTLAPGWGIWEVRLGIDKNANLHCVGFQIDTTSGTEVFVVA